MPSENSVMPLFTLPPDHRAQVLTLEACADQWAHEAHCLRDRRLDPLTTREHICNALDANALLAKALACALKRIAKLEERIEPLERHVSAQFQRGGG